MIRIAAADDSAMVREFLTEVLGNAPDMELVGLGANGADAIEIVRKESPDVLVLDLEMPGIGGLEVLKTVMREQPVRTLIFSSISGKLQSSMALRLGALEVLMKPENIMDEEVYEQAKTNLLDRIRTVARATLQFGLLDPTVAPRTISKAECPFDMITMAATSGSTATLLPVLKGFPKAFPTPVVVYPQLNTAMAAGFAEWLNSEISMAVTVGRHRTPLAEGTVHVVSPGRGIKLEGGHWVTDADYADDPGSGGLDASLTKLAELYGPRLLAVLLGGIGVDGLEGFGAVKKCGGTVLILDPGSAFTPDLPAAAIRQGLATETVPLGRMRTRVLELCHVKRG